MSKYPISNSDFYLRSGNINSGIDTNKKCSETLAVIEVLINHKWK